MVEEEFLLDEEKVPKGQEVVRGMAWGRDLHRGVGAPWRGRSVPCFSGILAGGGRTSSPKTLHSFAEIPGPERTPEEQRVPVSQKGLWQLWKEPEGSRGHK